MLWLAVGFEPARAGSILREVYAGIGGSSLADLTNNPAFPASPTSTSTITDFFETPTDSDENYGQRLRATFIAPVSGNYRFWIASDDASTLFLSTDASPANRRAIASVSGWTSSRDWGASAEQQSALIPLSAGQSYYIEAQHKEGGGGDNLAVRWLRPDGVDQGPIPLDQFTAWGQIPQAPRISKQPVGATVVEGATASFSVDYDNQGPTQIFWRRNGTTLPAQITKTLVVGPVTLADNGARFTALLTNALGTVISSEALLTVTADTVRPVLVSAAFASATQIELLFSEPVRVPAGAASSSFSLAPALAVTAAAQDADLRRIRLTTAAATIGTTYRLTINNVTDRAQAANGIAANTGVDLTTSAKGPFLIEAEDFNFDSGQNIASASVMPYLGGAYAGLQATFNVDFNRGSEGGSPAYRNDNRIPMDQTGDVSRADGAWTLTANYKLGWIGDGQWYNYTRAIPLGQYRVLVAMSHGEATPGAIRGSLQRVTAGATTATQTLEDLGTFNGDGTGGWGVNRLVPLRDGNGATRILQFGGTTTLRMNPSSGDLDYLLLVPATAPRIAHQPQGASVVEGRPVTFSVTTIDSDESAWQWRSNGVPIVGATGPTYTVAAAPLSADGTKYSVVVSNVIGSSTSGDASLVVTRDEVPPVVLRAFNTGLGSVVLEFDEPVRVPAGAVSTAFQISPALGINGATAGDASHRIVLAVAPMTVGTRYTVTVTGVTDRADNPNPVAAGSTVSFVASELSPSNLGQESVAGTVTRGAAGEFDLTARGGDIGGTADGAAFAWQPLNGNFDLRVRVADLAITDPYAVAGLMARVGQAGNGIFAGTFASSSRPGVFFESRGTAGGDAVVGTVRGGYPVNYPYTWLRLRRVGNELTGFGSLDGQRWTQVGSLTVPLPTQLSVGLALAGRDAETVAAARFREYGNATGAVNGPFVPVREGLGVSSRRTRIVVSEVHYDTAVAGPGSASEFIELFNAGDAFEDLSGWTIGGGVSFRFPAGFRMGAGQFVVVAADPVALKAATGLSTVLGPFVGALNNGGDDVEIRDELGARKLFVEFGDNDPWPVAASGTGHSLVLVNPSYGEGDPRAWAASAFRGGSPGNLDPIAADPADGVVINEALTHTDLPLVDFIELHNRTRAEINLSGCVLTDNFTTNRYRFPAGTTIPARGFLALDETQLGFRLSAAGETVFLVSSNGLRVLDAVRTGGQENGVSSGRSSDGSGEWRRLASRTPGAANASRRVEEVVINEINYHPITEDDDDEFVELHNRSAAAVDLAGWRFESGVGFTFPSGASIPAGGFVVVGGNRARLLSNHPGLEPAIVFGDWSGSLSNGGERLSLSKPDTLLSTNDLGEVTTTTIRILVADVRYRDGGRWGKWADGGGSSLELIDPRADPLRAASWADSDESTKASWEQVTLTDTLRFGSQTPDALHVGMMGAGECLLDEVQVLGPGNASLLANGGFESVTGTAPTGWSFLGHHSASRLESVGAFAGVRALRVVAPGDLDAGRNCIRAPLAAGLNNDIAGTIRARVRWVAGWPELLIRTRGGGLELTARMTVPRNLGTPGRANSRRVTNAGPAIFAVTHSPAVPDASQAVVVSARVADPDGISSVSLRSRVGESGAFTSVAMRDDGTGGDALAGDGVWSATLAGRAAGALVQFFVQAFDNAGTVVSTQFPSGPVFAGSPAVAGANIRWGDPVPFGTFEHIHSWTTQSVDDALGADGLNNTFRDGTLVHGNLRVIYNAGIRRKGSPFTGQADFAMTVPSDDLLLGASDRVYALTGNGGEEGTKMRNQIANWFTRGLRLPYLNANYIRFFRNGSPHGSVGEDLEQPNNDFAEGWFPDGGDGDLHKVAFWFEFREDGGFDVVGADLGNYRNPNGQFNLSRYRWNWQARPNGTTANDFTNFFALITAANSRATNYEANLLNLVDVDQWMRMFVLDACLGNWDTWGVGNNQNKYIYYQPGGRWNILPWDMDWVLGSGDGPSRQLFGGQDGNVNFMFDWPAFRRMAWRAYREAVDGPFQRLAYLPQFNARSSALSFNRIEGTSAPQAMADYLDARREFIRAQLNAADTAAFAITSNNGANFTSPSPTAVIEGTAPFAAAEIWVNGLPVPTEWLDVQRFRIRVPLTKAVNALAITGVDRNGNAIPGLADSITVSYTGAFEKASDFVVISEVQYNAAASGASFLELFNRSASTAFDLTGYRINGVGYTFPPGSVFPPGAYWVLVRDRAAFSLAYGAGVQVFDEFTGSLDNGGERIALVQPVAGGELLVTDVRYDNRLPWPTNAAGFGPSLQLVDAARGSWRVANWATTATNAANRVTPGAASSVAQSLVAFPNLWINEVLPNNAAGPQDNAGDRDPYVEIINMGPSAVSLSGLMLTDNFTNLPAWTFPAGTAIPAGGFLTVWADGEPGESVPGIPHTSFRLNPASGTVALVRRQGAANLPAVLDYLTWEQLPAGRSFGSIPDGEPRSRRILFNPTPGATNDPAAPVVNVVINEVMAQNTRTVADPADGDWDDWIELHNTGSQPVDLAGYYLTDNLTNSISSMFRIPGGYPIPAGGFLLVWADNETAQNVPANSDLHAGFALSRSGEQVGLFDPAGNLVDGFTFGSQTNDISLGRFPDAAAPPLYFMETPTPRAPNVLAGANRPPVFTAIADRVSPEQTEIAFTASAADPDAGQVVQYSLGPDAPAGATIHPTTGAFRWATSESDGPAAYSFLVRATDNGTPARIGSVRVNITVSEVNLPPIVVGVTNVAVAEGSLLSLQLPAADTDVPANLLAFAVEGEVPAGLTLSTAGLLTWLPGETLGGSVQTVRYRVTDNGSPVASAAAEVRISVLEVNNPPVFSQPAPAVLDELGQLDVQLVASDPEGTAVRFRLEGTVPAGLRLDESGGRIQWTPTEDQGPGAYVVLIRATDGSPEALSFVRELSLTVREQNQPPAMEAIADRSVVEGGTVTFRAIASDPDRPVQGLAFSLDPGAPAGATMDSVTGDFAWTTGGDQGASTNSITVRVTDNGPGNLSATRTFTVVTEPRFQVVLSEVLRQPLTPNTQFIELFNASSVTSWNLSGFRLGGSNLNFTFPANTILSPGGRLLVVQSLTAFRAAFGNAVPVVGTWTGTLGAVSDSIVLNDPAGAVRDRLDYDSGYPWPGPAGASALSMQLLDARRDRNRAGNWGVATAFTGNRNVIGFLDSWRYFQDGPPAGGTNWRTSAFNDGSWPSGGGLLYVETAAVPTNKTTALTLGQLTYYFRRKVTLPALPADVQVQINTILDDGYVLWINGRRAHSLGMDDTDPTHETVANRVVADAVLEGPFTIPASFLVPGENTFAVEVHQNASGSSDIVFGLEMTLVGGTAPAATPGLANSVSADLSEFPTLRINEVLARNATGITDQSGAREPWIELVNTGARAVALDGLFLSNDDANPTRWAFPAGAAIPAGAFLTIFADGEPAQSTSSELHAGFRLASTAGSPLRLTLSRVENGSTQAIDHLRASVPAAPDVASGRLPDGSVPVIVDVSPTPGGPNTPLIVNRPPVFPSVTGLSVDEGSTLDVQLAASDPDQPGQTLTFQRLSGPAGLAVSGLGRLTWSTVEADGPAVAPVIVRVSDNGSPALSVTNQFEILVREVNLAPAIQPVAEQRLSVGQAWSLDLVASDPDRPLQALSFERVSGPAALTVSGAGRVTWTPTDSDAGTNGVVVRVRDNGSPILSGEVGFNLVVSRTVTVPPAFDLPSFEADGRVRIVLRGTTGRRYRVETSTVWGQWVLLTEWTADPSGLTLLATPEAGNGPRLYRAVLLP
jgi:hypothetical protein